MRFIAPRTGAPEQTIAEDQGEYKPITVGVYGAQQADRALLLRATFTPEERAAIAKGEDLYIYLLTFGRGMTPIHAQVGSAGQGGPADVDFRVGESG